MYPVNFIGFNPRYDKYLYTGGSEGAMFFWDFQEKNKIKSFNFGNRSACSAAVNPNGQLIAYALGYDYHEGFEGLKKKLQNNIYIHIIPDNELKYTK